MKKQHLLFAAVGLVIVIAIAATVSVVAQPSITPEKYAAAKKTLAIEKCVAPNTALKVSSSDRSRIELIAISHLNDVPAGTNVDVDLASYSATEVTGSDRYPAQYGNYNFTMIRHDGDWVITKFKHCR